MRPQEKANFETRRKGEGSELAREGGRLRLLWVVMSRSLSLSGSTNGPLARQRYVGIGEREVRFVRDPLARCVSRFHLALSNSSIQIDTARHALVSSRRGLSQAAGMSAAPAGSNLCLSDLEVKSSGGGLSFEFFIKVSNWLCWILSSYLT